MKKIFVLFNSFLLLLFMSCNREYYQLVELESDVIKEDNNSLIASNDDLDLILDFWSNGGSTSFKVMNRSYKTLYIKHDECQLIINGRSKDYYDNSRYTSTSSLLNSKKRSSTAISPIKIYGKTQLNISTVTSSSSVLNSKSVTSEDKLIFVLHPDSYKNIEGFKIQDYIFGDCNVTEYPNKSNSNIDNGLSFNADNSPIKIRLIIPVRVKMTGEI